MSTTYLPISSDLELGAAIESFAESEEPQFSHVDVRVMTVDSRLFVKVEGTPAVELSVLAECHCFVIDVMAYSAEVDILSVDDGHMKLIRRGCGFRIGLAVEHLDGKLAASIQAVATRARLEGAKVWLKATTLGLYDLPVDKLALHNLTSSNFGEAFLAQLDQGVAALADFLADPDSRAKMSPQAVELAIVGGAVPNARNMVWTHRMALEGIQNGRSFGDQLTRCHDEPAWRARLLPAVMSDVYDCFGVEGTPTADQKDEVWHILIKGRGWGR